MGLLKYPQEGSKMFMYDDYRRILQQYGTADYAQIAADQQGVGFAFKCIHTMETTAKSYNESWEKLNDIRVFSEQEGFASKSYEMEKHLNGMRNGIQNKVSYVMGEYLLDHDMTIDSWAEPRLKTGWHYVNSSTNENILIPADCFGGIFMSKLTKEIGNEKQYMITQSESTTPPINVGNYEYVSDKLRKMRKQISEYKNVEYISKGKQIWNNVRSTICLIPLLYFITLLIILLVGKFGKIDLEAFYDNYVTTHDNNTVFMIFMWIGAFVSMVSKSIPFLYWVAVGLIAIAGFLVYAGFINVFKVENFWITGRKYRKGKEARKNLQELEKSAEYLDEIKFCVERSKKIQAVAKEWMPKWYEYCKEVYYK